jgi:hypothetical protein
MPMNYQCSEKFCNFLGNRIGNLPIDFKANLMKLKKIQIIDFHKINHLLVSVDTPRVGMTGFEPATTRPPAVYATGLRHIPFFLRLQRKYIFIKFKKMNLIF